MITLIFQRKFASLLVSSGIAVGRVLNTLRELKLDANTRAIFTSDNGPWPTKGHDSGGAGPLRGGIGSTWEGGVRETTSAWWPGRIPPASVCKVMAGNIDFLPTFVALAGGAVPADRMIDGRDFSPLLFDRSKEPLRAAHCCYHRGDKLEAVRSGPWQLALGSQVAGLKGAGSPPDDTGPEFHLYNLANDIGDGKPGPGVRSASHVATPHLLSLHGEATKP